MEVDQRFHATLRNFCLVWRVSGVPRRIFQHVTQNHIRRNRSVITLADEAAEDFVLVGDGTDFGNCIDFRHRQRQIEWGRGLDVLRHDCIGHRFETVETDNLEHVLHFLIVRADVTRDEGVVIFEFAESRVRHGEASV